MFWKLFSFEYYFLQYKHFLLVETFHITGGGAACNINVWFHCLVAAVTSPLHDYIWRNTASEGSTDECAATCRNLIALQLFSSFSSRNTTGLPTHFNFGL